MVSSLCFKTLQRLPNVTKVKNILSMNKATVPARFYFFLPYQCHWLALLLPFEALLGLPFNFFQTFHFLSSCRSLPQAGLRPLSSVQFSHSVVSDSLWLHGPQHARPPCPSPTPGVYSNSCPLSPWCHPTILSSVFPFSSRLQSFPASRSFQTSQFFASGGQSIQHQSFQWIFRTDFLYVGLVGSPCCPRDFQESSPTPQFKSISSLALSFLYIPTLTSIHDYWKNHRLASVGK